MPRRHICDIRFRGNPLEPGVHSESEGKSLKRMKEASRVRSSGVPLHKRCNRTCVIDPMNRTRSPQLRDRVVSRTAASSSSWPIYWAFRMNLSMTSWGVSQAPYIQTSFGPK